MLFYIIFVTAAAVKLTPHTRSDADLDIYYDCMNKREIALKQFNKIPAIALVAEQGETLTLSCFICQNPKVHQIDWQRYPFVWFYLFKGTGKSSIQLPVKNTVDDRSEDEGIFVDYYGDLTLTILGAKREFAEGEFFCKNYISGEIVQSYYVDITENVDMRMVIAGAPEDLKHLHPSPDVDIGDLWITTVWGTWNQCSEPCNAAGTRQRNGKCYVKANNAKLIENDKTRYIFSMFHLGIPCHSSLLPGNYVAQYMDQFVNHVDETQLQECIVLRCPKKPLSLVDTFFSIDDSLPELPPRSKRRMYAKKSGVKFVLQCPSYGGTKIWKKNTMVFTSIEIQIMNGNRVYLDTGFNLVFHRLLPLDSGDYSCEDSSGYILLQASLSVGPNVEYEASSKSAYILLIGVIVAICVNTIAMIFCLGISKKPSLPEAELDDATEVDVDTVKSVTGKSSKSKSAKSNITRPGKHNTQRSTKQEQMDARKTEGIQQKGSGMQRKRTRPRKKMTEKR